MSPTFFSVKKICPTENRGAGAPGFQSFSPGTGRWRHDFSGRTQGGQPFQVPTDAFELQFQPVGFAPHITGLEQTHLEERQRRTRRTPGRRRIHRLQRLFHRLPVQRPVEPFQKIIRRRGDHQAVRQSHLCVGRRLHGSLTHNQSNRSKEFCRGLHMINRAGILNPQLPRHLSGLSISPPPLKARTDPFMAAHNILARPNRFNSRSHWYSPCYFCGRFYKEAASKNATALKLIPSGLHDSNCKPVALI